MSVNFSRRGTHCSDKKLCELTSHNKTNTLIDRSAHDAFTAGLLRFHDIQTLLCAQILSLNKGDITWCIFSSGPVTVTQMYHPNIIL